MDSTAAYLDPQDTIPLIISDLWEHEPVTTFVRPQRIAPSPSSAANNMIHSRGSISTVPQISLDFPIYFYHYCFA